METNAGTRAGLCVARRLKTDEGPTGPGVWVNSWLLLKVYLVSNRFSLACHTKSFAMDSSDAKLNLCALQPVVTCHLEPF
jgi:hypothetical protein